MKTTTIVEEILKIADRVARVKSYSAEDLCYPLFSLDGEPVAARAILINEEYRHLIVAALRNLV